MSQVFAERKADGSFEVIPLATGQKHKVILPTLKLDHRYHDDDPVQEATYSVRFPNGYQVSGQLDAQGRARLVGVPSGQAEVRYGPDSRPFEPVEQDKNPDYRPETSSADIDALIDKYQNG
jgi:type VI secretion system secreted protein VgrG